ncbi:MAG: hypothetical protein L3K16_01160 [Thermoplasmata archaeon]|nr:hypothetical protein [Thermoplasmata archaeon]
MSWRSRPDDGPEPIVVDRIRAVEVPVLTEAKRHLVRGDVPGALRYAYPKVLEDLARAYGTAIPEGFSHEEIVDRGFTPEMAPLLDFFDRLYALYAPARFGTGPAPEAGDEVLELLQSLYSAEPMWRLYVTPSLDAAPAPKRDEAMEPVEEESPWQP